MAHFETHPMHVYVLTAGDGKIQVGRPIRSDVHVYKLHRKWLGHVEGLFDLLGPSHSVTVGFLRRAETPWSQQVARGGHEVREDAPANVRSLRA